MRSVRLISAFAVPLMVVIAVACGGGDSLPSTATPAPGGVETPTRSPAPGPPDKVDPIPERTGIAELDAIIDGFVSRSTKPLLPLLRYSTLPCTTASGIGERPGCRPDQEEGTPTEVMPVSTCEFELQPPHEFELVLARLVEKYLYGVYRATQEVRFPGDYVVMLSTAIPAAEPETEPTVAATEVIIENGRIVGVDFSCFLPPEELVELHRLEDVLFTPDAP